MNTNYADAASLVVGLVLPAIVAIFTRPSTNTTVKGVAHAVLAVATGSLTVYRAHPGQFYWAPALIAGFLAWISGTAFYHSLLKKYAWFGWLQNAVVREAKTLHTPQIVSLVNDFEQAAKAESTEPVNDFPLSTDVITSGVQEAVHAAEQIPVVGQVVQNLESAAVPAIVNVIEDHVPMVENPGA